MSGAAQEIELKFRLGPGAAARLAVHPALAGEESVQDLRSVYFDTPDQALRRAGWGLRVRATGRGFVQTLKGQTGGDVLRRAEWETPVSSEALDMTALKATPVAARLKGRRDLSPRFASTVRRRARLIAFEGAVIEAAYDEGDLSAGDRAEPLRELELELKDGPPEALFALARRLSADVALVPLFESKAERGWRLAEGAERAPRFAVADPLPRALTTEEALRRTALVALGQVSANAELLRRVRRPEALHQMRVGLRRLRAALSVFASLLGEDAEPVVAELRWLAHETDAARDLDVFIRDVFHPAALATPDPGLAPLGLRLLAARSGAYRRAMTAINSPRYAALMLETLAWIETGPWRTDPDPVRTWRRARPVAAFAGEALERLNRRVRRGGRRLDRLDAAGRHRLRIRVKRLRYAAEFFAGLFDHPRRERRFLKALETTQDAFGALNDLAVARDRIPAEARLTAPEIAFAAGRLIGRREQDAAALHAASDRAFARLSETRPFWRR
ncbi:CHAD domain-containing protein [Brevundimonas naejangsanensis]|uniref:CHAD domain-containing protein n=1 Tax=Brevundimonas naejangsanensis TaxID=588932 RepID=A0A494RM50_9CAUL|nr:CYTH and CHAD domain-containing protein [Brevundimonas naejangsanensis]AYG95062.1 CHAD domain-containing protein [Brevundimonas naejangsanensis]